MIWCPRHLRLLEDAVDLRGLDRDDRAFDALADAQRRIVTHATNFAGKTAVDMLTGDHCPLCFVNRNHARVNCDAWVDHAADETSAADIARRDAATDARSQLIVS